MKFSKIIVASIILLAILYTVVNFWLFAVKEIEMSLGFHGFVFAFLGSELMALAKLKLAEEKDKNQ